MSNTEQMVAASKYLHDMLRNIADDVEATAAPEIRVQTTQAGILLTATYGAADRLDLAAAWRECKRIAAERFPERKWYAMRCRSGRNTWHVRDEAGNATGMLRMGVAVERTQVEIDAICLGIWPKL